LNTAEAFVQGSIITRFAFGTDLIPFLTEGWLTPKTDSQNAPDWDAFSWATAGGGASRSWGISLAEIVQYIVPGGADGSVDTHGGSMPKQIMQNMRATAIPAVASSIATNIGFRVIKKVTSKQRRQVNNGLKMIGLRKEVMV